MSGFSWQETRATLKAAGPTLATSVTATSLLNTNAKGVLYADDFVEGKMIKCTMTGVIGTALTPTIIFDVRFGAVIVANSLQTAVTLTTQATPVAFWVEFLMTVRAVGSGTTANLFHHMTLVSTAVGGTAPVASGVLLPATSTAVGTGFDSTAAQVVDVFAKWSASSASNTVTAHQYRLEVLN